MEPIRTEYRGNVYDSKSEAVFARTLDIAQHDWVYHPERHCGHVWDFLVLSSQYHSGEYNKIVVGGKEYLSKGLHPVIIPKPMLVEYKPSPPTETYVEELTKKMRDDPVESVLVWGNPWDKSDPLNEGCCYHVFPIFCSYDKKYGWGDFEQWADNGEGLHVSWRHPIIEILMIEGWMAQEAKKYRFDLLEP